jgi:hypothetical protein
MGNLLFSLSGEGGKRCILIEDAGNVVNVGATTESCPYKFWSIIRDFQRRRGGSQCPPLVFLKFLSLKAKMRISEY